MPFCSCFHWTRIRAKQIQSMAMDASRARTVNRSSMAIPPSTMCTPRMGPLRPPELLHRLDHHRDNSRCSVRSTPVWYNCTALLAPPKLKISGSARPRRACVTTGPWNSNSSQDLTSPARGQLAQKSLTGFSEPVRLFCGLDAIRFPWHRPAGTPYSLRPARRRLVSSFAMFLRVRRCL